MKEEAEHIFNKLKTISNVAIPLPSDMNPGKWNNWYKGNRTNCLRLMDMHKSKRKKQHHATYYHALSLVQALDTWATGCYMNTWLSPDKLNTIAVVISIEEGGTPRDNRDMLSKKYPELEWGSWNQVRDRYPMYIYYTVHDDLNGLEDTLIKEWCQIDEFKETLFRLLYENYLNKTNRNPNRLSRSICKAILASEQVIDRVNTQMIFITTSKKTLHKELLRPWARNRDEVFEWVKDNIYGDQEKVASAIRFLKGGYDLSAITKEYSLLKNTIPNWEHMELSPLNIFIKNTHEL